MTPGWAQVVASTRSSGEIPMTRTRNPGRDPYVCSFCGRGQDEVQRLIAGPGNVFICDECVAMCSQIIAEENEQKVPATRRTPPPGPARLPTPRKLRERLDQYVIGQDRAKVADRKSVV